MMARVPISFCINVLAGVIVLFNHYAASETGDLALNKVTGAAGRFYTLFRDTVLTIQHGCTSHLETILCGSTVESLISHDAAAYLRVRYCHHPLPAQNSKSDAGSPNDRQPGGGYGGSGSAIVYHQPPVWPLVLRTYTKGFVDAPSQRRVYQAVWDRTNEVMEMIGTFVLRGCALWWWLRAPLQMTGYLLAAYAALSSLDYVFGTSAVIQCVSQVFVVVVADFLRCTEWEARRLVVNVGVMIMEQVYGLLVHVG